MNSFNNPSSRKMNNELNRKLLFGSGNPQTSFEIITPDKNRLFYWEKSIYDDKLASIAGWKDLVHASTDVNTNCLEIPLNARRSSSVLGGVEAWAGEKSEVISFIGKYIVAVADTFKAVDTSLSLDTVSVARGNSLFFVTPPHYLTDASPAVDVWLQELHTDVAQVLERDPKQAELVHQLDEALVIMQERIN